MQLHLSKFTAVLLAGLILAGCGSAPIKLTGNEPLTVKDFVEIDDDYKLAGVKRVAIPNFFVQFVRDETIEVKASYGMVARGSESYTVQTRVDDATLQNVADKLYADFVGELKAVGIEVMPISEMDENKDFQTIRKEGRTSPFVETAISGGMKGSKNEKLNGVSVLVSAQGLPINVIPAIDKIWLTPSAKDGFKMSLNMASGTLPRTLKVPLLNVRMTVSMIAAQGTTSSSAYSSNWKFKAEPYPRFVEQGTLINLVVDGDDNKFSLSKPIVIKDIGVTGSEGKGTGARGSGLFGLLERGVRGAENMEADAYFDVDAAQFTARTTARGKEVSHLLVQAMTK